MNLILNERVADKEVIQSLRRTIVRYHKERGYMGQFYKDNDGSIKQVVAYEDVNRDDLVQAVENAQSALAEYDSLVTPEVAPEEPTAPEAPVAEAPQVQPEQPVVEQPAPAVETAEPAPITETPVEQPAPEAQPEPVQPAQVDLTIQ